MRAMILATFTGLALAIAGPAFAQSRAPSAAAEAPADVPETPFLTGVVWLEQPDAQTFARLYPQQAIDVRAEGRVHRKRGDLTLLASIFPRIASGPHGDRRDIWPGLSLRNPLAMRMG